MLFGASTPPPGCCSTPAAGLAGTEAPLVAANTLSILMDALVSVLLLLKGVALGTLPPSHPAAGRHNFAQPEAPRACCVDSFPLQRRCANRVGGGTHGGSGGRHRLAAPCASQPFVYCPCTLCFAAAWILRGRLALRSAAHITAMHAMQPLRHAEATTAAVAAAQAHPGAGQSGSQEPEQQRHAQPQRLPAGYNAEVEELRQREFRRLQRHVYAGKWGAAFVVPPPLDVTQAPLLPPGRRRAWMAASYLHAVPAAPVGCNCPSVLCVCRLRRGCTPLRGTAG